MVSGLLFGQTVHTEITVVDSLNLGLLFYWWNMFKAAGRNKKKLFVSLQLFSASRFILSVACASSGEVTEIQKSFSDVNCVSWETE